MVSQAVGQFEVLIIGDPSLYPPHLLEGFREFGEEPLETGVLQGRYIQQAAGQLDVVVRQLLVGGAHLVRAGTRVLQLLMVRHQEGLLRLEELVNVLLCAGEEELVPGLLEGGEYIHQPLLLVLPPDVKVLLVLQEHVQVPVSLEHRVGRQPSQEHLVLGHCFLYKPVFKTKKIIPFSCKKITIGPS